MSLDSPQQSQQKPPVATVVQPPSAYEKPVYQGYTYAYPPQSQSQTQTQTQWVNPSYQPQMYAPQQQLQMYPPQQQQHYQYQYPQYPPQQQHQNQGPSTGMAIAGGLIAGMLAANVLDDITDPY
jgi:hypothetical protein